MAKLLIVDDEPTICWGLTQLGESLGHEVATASSAEKAFQIVDQNRPDLIILDVRLPGMDGLKALGEFQKLLGNIPVVIITAYGDLQTAVRAIQNGAFEYIVKPFELTKMEKVLQRALESVGGQQSEQDQKQVEGLVGRTTIMQNVFKNIALAASSDTNIILSGESGTGKELAARAIHQFSDRSSGPFVAVNVASLSMTLAESELFGHSQGAFTGAEKLRVGLIEQAHGGTLFLDEVADIPLSIQVKLLRVLDLDEVLPVGANKTVKADCRVISATHQSLERKIQEGQFRHDLYFRLCGFQIEMPPLRDRQEDIPELAKHFLNRLTHNKKLQQSQFSDETFAELQRRPWYGNVRELSNAVEHAALLARGGIITPEYLPEPVSESLIRSCESTVTDEEQITENLRQWASSKLLDTELTGKLHEEFIQFVEKPLLETVLKKENHQYTTAARILGMHRTTLKKKMDQYDITPE